jgi:hypothetical protein
MIPQNYNTRSEYDQHMLKMYHSPVWVQNDKTRTHFDLDLQKQMSTNKNRFIPQQSQPFVARDTAGQQPWDGFKNVMAVKEGYAGNAYCNTERTTFDLDMNKSFNTLGNRMNGQQPWGEFVNLEQTARAPYGCPDMPMPSGPGRMPMPSGPGRMPMPSGPGRMPMPSGPGRMPMPSGPGRMPMPSGPGRMPMPSGPGRMPMPSGPAPHRGGRHPVPMEPTKRRNEGVSTR